MGSEQPIVFLTSIVPPKKDGVGDYTYHLGREVAKSYPVRIITTVGEREERDGCSFQVLPVVPRWSIAGTARLSDLLGQLRPILVNVQWVPYLWGRRGVNLALPLRLLQLWHAKYRIVTTVHEPYVPFDAWSRFVTGPLQRLMFLLTILGSAKVAVTTSAWTRKFQDLFPWKRDDIFWLPVGSNIPEVPISSAERTRRRRQLGLDETGLLIAVFNPLGSGKSVDLVFKAWDAILRQRRNAKLLMLGCYLEEIRRRFPWTANSEGLVCTGYLETAKVSQWLSCADIFLSPLVDGISARRASVIAAMAHGLPIVTTRGHLTDRQLFDQSPLVFANAGDEGGFVASSVKLAMDEGAQASLRGATRQFYRIHFSWPEIAKQFLKASLIAHPRVATGDTPRGVREELPQGTNAADG